MHLQVAAFVALISGAAVSAERVRYGARTIAPGETTDGSVRWMCPESLMTGVTQIGTGKSSEMGLVCHTPTTASGFAIELHHKGTFQSKIEDDWESPRERDTFIQGFAATEAKENMDASWAIFLAAASGTDFDANSCRWSEWVDFSTQREGFECKAGHFIRSMGSKYGGEKEARTMRFECCSIEYDGFCGDGVVDRKSGEECDQGSDNADTGLCTATCKRARCGDGFVQPDNGEVCDNGKGDLCNEKACSEPDSDLTFGLKRTHGHSNVSIILDFRASTSAPIHMTINWGDGTSEDRSFLRRIEQGDGQDTVAYYEQYYDNVATNGEYIPHVYHKPGTYAITVNAFTEDVCVRASGAEDGLQVTIQDPVSVQLRRLHEEAIQKGDYIRLQAITQGTDPQFAWYMNGDKLPQTGNTVMMDSSELLNGKVDDHIGNYNFRVEVSNMVSSDGDSTSVTVVDVLDQGFEFEVAGPNSVAIGSPTKYRLRGKDERSQRFLSSLGDVRCMWNVGKEYPQTRSTTSFSPVFDERGQFPVSAKLLFPGAELKATPLIVSVGEMATIEFHSYDNPQANRGIALGMQLHTPTESSAIFTADLDKSLSSATPTSSTYKVFYPLHFAQPTSRMVLWLEDGSAFPLTRVVIKHGESMVSFYFGDLLQVADEMIYLDNPEEVLVQVIKGTYGNGIDVTTALQEHILDNGGLGMELGPQNWHLCLGVSDEQLIETFTDPATGALFIEYRLDGVIHRVTFYPGQSVLIPSDAQRRLAFGLGRLRVKVASPDKLPVGGIIFKVYGTDRHGNVSQLLGRMVTDRQGYSFADFPHVFAGHLQTLHLVPLTGNRLLETSPSRSIVFGPGLHYAHEEAIVDGRPAYFFIQSKDMHGENQTQLVHGDNYTVLVTVEDITVSAHIDYVGGGLHLVRYYLPMVQNVTFNPTEIWITVMLENQPVYVAPYPVPVVPCAMDPNAINCANITDAWNAVNNLLNDIAEAHSFENNFYFPRHSSYWDERGWHFDIDMSWHLQYYRDTGSHYDIVMEEDIMDILARDTLIAQMPTGIPDAHDLLNSPASFDHSASDAADGDPATSSLSMAPNWPTRSFRFAQSALLEDPSVRMVCVDSFDRKDCNLEHYPSEPMGPIDPDEVYDTGELFLASSIVRGQVLRYEQKWLPRGHSRGDLVKTKSLAPGQIERFAILENDLTQQTRTSQSFRASSSLSQRQSRMRSVRESSSANVREVMQQNAQSSQQASSSSGGMSASAGGSASFFGLVSASSGFSGSYSASSSSSSASSSASASNERSVAAEMVNQINDQTSFAATSARSSTRYTFASDRQSEVIQASTNHIFNANPHNALTVEYYQVLRHYMVVTQLTEVVDVLYIPYHIPPCLMVQFPPLLSDLARQERTTCHFKAMQWVLRHAAELVGYGPEYTQLKSQLQSVLSSSIWDDVGPVVESLHVKLSNRWRPSVSIYIEKANGQFVKSVPYGGQFSSSSDGSTGASQVELALEEPVRLEEVKSVQLMYEGLSSESEVRRIRRLTNGSYTSMKDRAVYPVNYVSISGWLRSQTSTDREYASLSTLSSQQVLQENDKVVLPVAPTEISKALRTFNTSRVLQKAYHDIVEFMEIIRADPVSAAQMVWLSEPPQRRALRFQQYKYNERPLLQNIQNEIVSVVGNLVGFPLVRDGMLRVRAPRQVVISRTLVSLPASGLNMDVRLSEHVATSRIDPTREVDLEFLRAMDDISTKIDSISLDSRRASPLQAPDLDTSSPLKQQDPLTVPDPSGLSGILEAAKTFTEFNGLKDVADVAAKGLEVISTANSATMKDVTAASSNALDKAVELQKKNLDVFGDMLGEVMKMYASGSLIPGKMGSDPSGASKAIGQIDALKNSNIIDEDMAMQVIKKILGTTAGGVAGGLV